MEASRRPCRLTRRRIWDRYGHVALWAAAAWSLLLAAASFAWICPR